MWELSALAHGGKSPDSVPPQNEGPPIERAQNAQQVRSKGGSSPLKTSGELPQKESNIRSIKKEKNIKNCGTTIPIDFPFAGESTAIESTLRDDALFAFDNELPERRQNEILAKFVETEFPHGFLPPSRVIRSLVAVSWFQHR